MNEKIICKEKVRVAIGLCVKNAEETVKEALRSILRHLWR